MNIQKCIVMYLCLNLGIIFSADNKNNSITPILNSAKKKSNNRKNNKSKKNPAKNHVNQEKNLKNKENIIQKQKTDNINAQKPNTKNDNTTQKVVNNIQKQINVTNKKIKKIKQNAKEQFNVDIQIDEDLTAKIENAADDIAEEMGIKNQIILSAQLLLKEYITLAIMVIVFAIGFRFIGATKGSKNLKETLANFTSTENPNFPSVHGVGDKLIENGLTITTNTLSELKESFYDIIKKAKNTVIEKLTNSYPVNSDNIESLLQNKKFIESHSENATDYLISLQNTLEYLEKNQKALPIKMKNFKNDVASTDDILLRIYLNSNPITTLDITKFKFDKTYGKMASIATLRKMNLIINGKIDSQGLLKNLKKSGLIKDSSDPKKLLSLDERIKNLTPKGDKLYNYDHVLAALQQKKDLISLLKKNDIIANDGQYFHPLTIKKYFELTTMPENHPDIINKEHEIKFVKAIEEKRV